MQAREIIKIGKKVNFLAISSPEPWRVATEDFPLTASQMKVDFYLVQPEMNDDGEVLFKMYKADKDGYLEELQEFDEPSALYGELIKIVKTISAEERETFILFYQPEEIKFPDGAEFEAFMQKLRMDSKIVLFPLILGVVGINPKIPSTRERMFYRVSASLPDEEWRKRLLFIKIRQYLEREYGIEKSDEEIEKMLRKEQIQKYLILSKGMIGEEILNAVKFSMESFTPQKPKLDFKKFIKVKENLIRQNPVLEIYHPQDVDPLVGFEMAWQITEKAFEKNMMRGLLLLGIPGMGKSLFAKNLAKRFELPTIFFDLSRVFGSYVGESERKMDEALKTIEEIGAAIVVIDEIDKVMAGMGQGGRGDSGVSERVFGKFHTWLQDRKSKSFIIATANDISHLPASLFRAGRWNAILYVDYYPTSQHYEKLLEIYAEKYGLDSSKIDIDPTKLKEEKFTGAEVADLVEKAYMFNIPLSQTLKMNLVIPISKAEPEKLAVYEQYRGRYIPAHSETEPRVFAPKTVEDEEKEPKRKKKRKFLFL